MVEAAHEHHARRRRRFHTGDVGQIFHVSRASLVYYEKAGLIHPIKNPDTGLREYTISDLSKLYEFRTLANLGMTAEQIVNKTSDEDDLFDEDHLENYLKETRNQIDYYEALRESLDYILALRIRDEHGPQLLIEPIEEFLFVGDNAEDSFDAFIRSASLDSLIEYLPISSFGILYSFDETGNTSWQWGRTVPRRLASITGIRSKDALPIGDCDCVTMIGHITDESIPPSASAFRPLYDYAEQMGRTPAGDPFVPFMFPPYIGSPHKVCLPLVDSN